NSLQSSNPYRRVYEIEIDTVHCSSSYSGPYANYKQLPKACEPTDKSRRGAVGYVDYSIDVYQNLARIRRKDPKAIIVINAHIAPLKKCEEKNLALLERLSQLPDPPTFIALDNKAADYAYVPYKFIKSVKWVKISGETKGKERKNDK